MYSYAILLSVTSLQVRIKLCPCLILLLIILACFCVLELLLQNKYFRKSVIFAKNLGFIVRKLTKVRGYIIVFLDAGLALNIL